MPVCRRERSRNVGRDTLVTVPYRVANAPVSFGAWSLESSGLAGVPEPARVLAEVAAAGYDGIELGPLGFLDPTEIAAHGLQLAGAYVPIPFGDGLGPLSETLDVLDAVAPAARPILADDGATTTPLDPDDVARAVDAARRQSGMLKSFATRQSWVRKESGSVPSAE